MPKLTKKVAAEVEKSEAMGGSFLLPDGRYALRLGKVEERPGTEHPQWSWEFDAIVDEDGDRKPGRLWHNTSLSPKSRGFLKATFEAFGYSPDSDTDEMIGEWVVGYVSQSKQLVGKNAGQMRNNIDRLAPFDADDWDFNPDEIPVKPATDGAGGGDGDDF